jgi:hypothetical protein
MQLELQDRGKIRTAELAMGVTWLTSGALDDKERIMFPHLDKVRQEADRPEDADVKKSEG